MSQTGVTMLAGVQFHAVGKIYHFDATHLPTLKKGDLVVVETTRGRQIGRVMTLTPPTEQTDLASLRPIERIATGRDLALRRYWRNKEAPALTLGREIASRLRLPLKVIGAEYSLDGTRLMFLYTAEDKVDTQEWKRELTNSFRARVELRLVGPRDVARCLGGYGACGELQCCSTFLTDFSSISIKMAKEQGISLNPQEITGMCGRLRCCLAYEYDQYAQARKNLPKVGKPVGTPHGRGTVVEVLPLQDAVIVQIGEQRFRVARTNLLPMEEHEPLPRRATPPREEAGKKRPARERPPRPEAETPAAEPTPRRRRRRHKHPAA